MSTPNQTETLVFLDRNVVSVVKDANAGKRQKGTKELAMLERLRAIDKPFHSVTPLFSLIEGEHGRKPSADELFIGLTKEARALDAFFEFATTDSLLLTYMAGVFVETFTGMQEVSEVGRAQLLVRGASLVVQKIAPPKRRAVEEKLRDIAEDLCLQNGDAALMLLMACLYGNDLARDVIKPSQLIKKPHGADKTYNVLSDIHLIPLLESIRIEARKSPIPLHVQFWTLDEGLDHVLKNVAVAASEIGARGEIQLRLAYLPDLFPDLSKDEAVALVARLTTLRAKI
ncbi:hypothetical protein G3O00_40710 [Burkholderia sp. Ac-20384]|uniref:hypothetical protein n=1 Tax=Burkholderia sp. Ac-20384 TaxID=2703902 RepID=UPI0019827095|nr:hypothetical protein [Burkholderia sp. Ac-20384]MBN3829851.1 hypothetical protein [Burkholderia sp. Ac-20384]